MVDTSRAWKKWLRARDPHEPRGRHPVHPKCRSSPTPAQTGPGQIARVMITTNPPEPTVLAKIARTGALKRVYDYDRHITEV
jgi:hypothetical protein